MRLAINAVSLGPGGGVNGLLGYLRAWREIGADLAITLYASRQPVLDAVRTGRPDITVVPFAVGMSPGRHFFLQQSTLAGQIEASGADVVMTTGSMVGRCHVPQLTHHRDLRRFLYKNPLPWLRTGAAGEAIRDYFARRAVRKSACNVYISDYMRRQAESLVPKSASRNHVVYNGLSSELLAAARAQTDGWQGEPHLMAVQSSMPHKDNPTLLRVLAHLIRTRPETKWEMSVAFTGDWSAVRALAKQLGISERVHFLGYIGHDRMDDLLRRSVCLVHTSVLEGFGNAPLEAMARRCPVVACNVTAMPEVIGDAGVLVSPGQPSDFADAVTRLYEDSAYRQTLVERGLERIGRFRWADSAAEMERLLRMTAERS